MATNTARVGIIHTKVLPPRAGADLVARARLLNRMRSVAQRTVTLVSAPAGSGKSTLLAQWAAQERMPVAWLSLDAADSSPAVFVAYLVAALRRIFPRALPEIDALAHASNLPPMSYLATRLVNDLADLPRDFVLVLDDYHNIHDAAVHSLLARVIDFMPHQMHLVVSTRIEPPLPLGRLRAAGRLLELRLRDLRFSGEEIEEFLERATHQRLPAELLVSLEESTEGWGVGLRMAAIALAEGGDAEELVLRLQEAQQQTLVYLAQEVLAQQPPEVQAFLLRTCIVDRLCAPLGDALVEGSENAGHSADILDALQRANLFMTALDPRAPAPREGGTLTWHRYQTFFREFLNARLRALVDSAEVRDLHARAARWFVAERLSDEALHHARLAGDLDIYDAVLASALTDLLNGEDRQRLDRWIALAPDGAPSGRPWLTLARCWQSHWRAQVPAIGVLLAEQFPDWRPDQPLHDVAPEMAGQVDLLQSTLAIARGQAELAVALGKRALATLSQSALFARGLAHVYIASGLQHLGCQDEYRELAEAEIQAAGDHFTVYHVRVGIALSLIYMNGGQWHELQRSARRLYEESRSHGLAVGANWGRYGMAVAGFESGHFDAALQHFTGLTESPYTAHVRGVIDSYLFLAHIHAMQNDWERATDWLDAVEPMVARSGTPRMECEVLAARARLALARGQIPDAYQILTPLREDTPLRAVALSPDILLNFLAPGATLVRVLCTYGTRESLREAQETVGKLLSLAQAHHFVGREIELLVVQAEVRRALGNEAGALESLERALTLAEPRGGTRVFVDSGAAIPDLLRRLAARGIAAPFAQQILQAVAAAQGPKRPATGAQDAYLVDPLTNRELDVLELVAQRWSNKEVATSLVISPMTVQRHLTNIYQKLSADNRRDAVAKARALGLIG